MRKEEKRQVVSRGLWSHGPRYLFVRGLQASEQSHRHATVKNINQIIVTYNNIVLLYHVTEERLQSGDAPSILKT